MLPLLSSSSTMLMRCDHHLLLAAYQGEAGHPVRERQAELCQQRICQSKCF